jgi:hypothetical protein
MDRRIDSSGLLGASAVVAIPACRFSALRHRGSSGILCRSIAAPETEARERRQDDEPLRKTEAQRAVHQPVGPEQRGPRGDVVEHEAGALAAEAGAFVAARYGEEERAQNLES